MKAYRGVRLALFSLLLVLPFIVTSPAIAASPYDSSLRTVTELYAGTPNDRKDFATEWVTFLLDPSSDYMSTGPCSVNIACSSMQNSLQHSYNNGDYTVTRWDYIGPDWATDNSVESWQIVVMYTMEQDTSLEWGVNHVDLCSDSVIYSVGIQYEQGVGHIVNASSIDTMYSCIGEVSNSNASENYFNEYLFEARVSDPNYPDEDPPNDYEGQDLPPSPDVSEAYSGTIDCGGEDPVLMSFYQVGNNGAATLTPLTTGRAQWDYSLSSKPYSITVDCGGTLASSSGTVDPLTTSKDWVCDVYGTEPYYCVVS